MTRIRLIPALILSLAVAANVGFAQGQGKGKGNEKKAAQAQKADRGQGKNQRGKPDHAKSNNRQNNRQDNRADNRAADRRGGKSPFRHKISTRDIQPNLRSYVTSRRAPERVAAGAVVYAFARGVDRDNLIIDNSNNRVRVKNRGGDILIDLDEDRARNLGAWDVRPYRDDDVKSGAPAFCRSGAGHPVWGRQWCVDKGFGLGRSNDVRWGRTTSTIGDIIFGQRIVDQETLLRDALIATVGNVVLDRLGLHALTMGYTEPLTGTWVAQPTGPRVLMLSSGTYPVAEVVDTNRDNRADLMLVALRPW